MSAKTYTIKQTRYSFSREPRTSYHTGTIKELTEYFGYTLECGKSWEHERGNKKINLAPRTIDSLVKNLNNAANNSAANGCANTWYSIA